MHSQITSRATTTEAPAFRSPRRWLTLDRASGGLSFTLLLLIEVIPIQACLLTYAAATAQSLANMFGPLWLIVTLLLQWALARRWLRDKHAAWLTLVSAVIGIEAVALFIALSPTAYGSVPGGIFSTQWLDQLQTDAIINSARFNNLFGIAPFVAYLGWRGLALGAEPPRIEVTLRRFTVSLAAVIAACLVALTAPSALQPALQGQLLTLVALDVFAGLASAALARRGGGRETMMEGSDAEAIRWMLNAFGAAALVVSVAFIIGLALNLSMTRPLLAALGPVGAAINAGITWLTNAVAYLLWIAFVKTLGAWLLHNSSFTITAPHSAPSLSSQPHHKDILMAPPMGFLVAAGIIVGLALLAVLSVILYTAIRYLVRTIHPTAEAEVDEEREGLDARGMLRRQMTDLLGRWRRGAGEVDPLSPGSARWLYRETLRAGASAGMARRRGETADEYSQRLAGALTATGAHPQAAQAAHEAALATLTRAYDDARYGESDAPPPPHMASEAHGVADAVARLRGGR